MKVSVLAPHTQWGDRLFFANSHTSWIGHELKTTRSTFPWWCTEDDDGVKMLNDKYECKCYIQRGDMRIWESFQGNRCVGQREDALAIKFNGMSFLLHSYFLNLFILYTL